MEEANLKGYVLYDSNYMTLYDIHGNSKKDQWLPEVKGDGGMKSQNKENFYGRETNLYDTTKVNRCHYTFVQTHGMYSNNS